MTRDTPEAAGNAAGADRTPAPIGRPARTKKTAPAPVSAGRSDIESPHDHVNEAAEEDYFANGPTRRTPMNPTRREAFEPLLNWIADQLIEQLLAEKRLELEAERKAQANQGAPS